MRCHAFRYSLENLPADAAHALKQHDNRKLALPDVKAMFKADAGPSVGASVKQCCLSRPSADDPNPAEARHDRSIPKQSQPPKRAMWRRCQGTLAFGCPHPTLSER
jgi:hypothetical protein